MGLSGKDEKEIIRRIAYRIYQERMRLKLSGDALSDWVKAEKEWKEWKKKWLENRL